MNTADENIYEQDTTTAMFNTWLSRKLHEMFDSVAREPISDDMVKLVEQLDKSERKPE